MVANSELEPNLKRTLSVWWLMAWRGTLCGALMGGALGVVIGIVSLAMQWSPQSMQLMATIAGSLVGLAWGVVVLRMALRKKYNGFRIALVPVAMPA